MRCELGDVPELELTARRRRQRTELDVRGKRTEIPWTDSILSQFRSYYSVKVQRPVIPFTLGGTLTHTDFSDLRLRVNQPVGQEEEEENQTSSGIHVDAKLTL